jgi:O-antigen/teichoic acid export membrane protein
MRYPFALIKSEFVRSVATLMSGNFLAQAITLGAAPIVTRLFSPEEFGLFAIIMAIIRICSLVGSLCYERATLLPKKETDAEAALILSVLVLFAFVAVIGFVSVYFGKDVARFLGNIDLVPWTLMIPVGVMVLGLNNILHFWALRHKRFRLMSSSRVVEAAVGAFIKILFGFLVGSWSGGLLIGTLFGSAIALLLLFHGLFSGRMSLSAPLESVRGIKDVAVNYRQFPMFAFWNALLTTSLRYIPVFFLSAFFGPTVVGFFNLASRILAQPITAIANSVSSVYFQKSASQRANDSLIADGLLKIMLILFVLGIIPFLLLAIYAVEVFSFVFGEMWQVAGFYTQIMTPWFFLIFLSAPAGIVYEVCRRQRQKLVITFLSAVASISVMGWFYHQGESAAVVIGAFVAVNSLLSIVQILLAIKIARESDRASLGHSIG